MPGAKDIDLVLRDVTEADLPVLFEHQREPEANEMAAFPPRDWDAFVAHWGKIAADDTCVAKAIVHEGCVAGQVGSFDRSGHREVGYWIGREHWGKGIATKALAAFLEHDRTRPLQARVVKHNIASVRVLEKCGFTVVGEEAGDDGVEELVFELSS